MAERPEDLNLPNSVIARIIKEALPESVNVSKDARLAISKAASVFVLYATSCANNFAMNHKRKTITPQDVLEAMKEMEFERFTETLQQSLQAYKQGQKEKKAASQAKKKETGSGDKNEVENSEAMENAEAVENTENTEVEQEGEVEDTAEDEVVISDEEENEDAGGGDN